MLAALRLACERLVQIETGVFYCEPFEADHLSIARSFGSQRPKAATQICRRHFGRYYFSVEAKHPDVSCSGAGCLSYNRIDQSNCRSIKKLDIVNHHRNLT